MRLIDRVATALLEACEGLVLVANDPAAAEWRPDLTLVADARPGAGALGGLHAALTYAGSDVITLPWDAPFVPGLLLRSLRERGELGDVDAAVPSSRASRWGFEPLCGWYTQSCLPVIERRIDAGDYRAGGWLHEVRTANVDVSAWGDPAVLFYNVNTAEDLVRAEQISSTRSGS